MSYTTIDIVRTLDRMNDMEAFPDDLVTEAIAEAKLRIDRFCGTTFGVIEPDDAEYTEFTVKCDGGRQWVILRDFERQPIPFPRTITAVSELGEDLDPADFDGWILRPEARIYRTSGRFPTRLGGYEIEISGTAGYSDRPNETIAWCARTLAREWLLAEQSKINDRATAVDGEFGTIPLAMPTAGNSTGLPSVDSRLKKYRFRWVIG